MLSDQNVVPSELISDPCRAVASEQYVSFPALLNTGLRRLEELRSSVEERQIAPDGRVVIGAEMRIEVDGVPLTGTFFAMNLGAPPMVPMVKGEYAGVTILDRGGSERCLFLRGPLPNCPRQFAGITAKLKTLRIDRIDRYADLSGLRI